MHTIKTRVRVCTTIANEADDDKMRKNNISTRNTLPVPHNAKMHQRPCPRAHGSSSSSILPITSADPPLEATSLALILRSLPSGGLDVSPWVLIPVPIPVPSSARPTLSLNPWPWPLKLDRPLPPIEAGLPPPILVLLPLLRPPPRPSRLARNISCMCRKRSSTSASRVSIGPAEPMELAV
jgi:hypothetical protein